MIRKLVWPLALALGLQAAMMTLLGQLALGEGLPRLPAATRCVNPGGTGGCFARIQDAINASSAGDRVNVASGVYTEHITMKEGVSVYGEGIFLTILDGGYAAAQSMVTFPPGVSASTVLSGVMIAGGGDGGTTAFVQGGGLNIEYASPSITNVLIINNTALRGGGVFVNSGSPTFDQALVWTNRAQDGGGFYLQNEADVTIRGNVFDPNVLAFGTVFSNTATNEGGGLFISPNVTATLTGLRVISNAASTGGGFYMVSNPYRVAIGLSDISFNQASTLGGGFYGFRATNLLIGLNFINFNTAANEGGAMAFSQSGGLVQGNIFNGNRSTGGSGGAVSMFSTSTGPALKGNWFENNSASAGGGLNLETGAMPLVEANTFVTNTAALGGGIYMFQAGAVTVTNNIVANNIATGGGNAGAGIAVVESPARVTNNTFANNQGDGVWFTKAEGVAVANNIIAGNTSDGIERYLNDTTSYTADYNDVFNNTLQNYRGLAAGGNDLSVNPKFVAAGPNLAEYYHLRPTSPVSAAGAISWAPEHDIDGDLRIAGGSVSMGADELPDAALAVSKSAEPGQYQAGAALTYTIRVTNTGGVTLTTTITDDLPGQVTPNNPVVWALVITPSQVWTKQIVVTVNAGYSGTLTNVVRAVAPQGASDEFTHAAQPVPTTPPGFPVYLPLIRR